ncbi:MAG TPA: hypothetical protein VNT76_20570 [Candidatus Binatus sp.]|nr:hypothetical protein [Candidatus Binatus sp.]
MSETKKPQQAGTVILLREIESQRFEVFLTRRPDAMPFLGGMYCYPGGSLSAQDSSSQMIQRCAGLSPKQARQILGAHFSPPQALGLWIAAVRELFEEVGVLLAVDECGDTLRPDAVRQARLKEKHAALLGKSISFFELLESEKLLCDLARVRHFSHWQTPAQVAMRFDTRFFITALPDGQTPLETSYEVAHSVWLTPDRALQLFSRGELPLIFPTFAALRTLADYATLDSVMREFRLVLAAER